MNNVILRPGDVATVKRKPPTFSPTTGTRESSKRPTKGRVIAVTPWFATLLFDSGVKEAFHLDEIMDVNPSGSAEPVLGKEPKRHDLVHDIIRPRCVSPGNVRRMIEMRRNGRSDEEIAGLLGTESQSVRAYMEAVTKAVALSGS